MSKTRLPYVLPPEAKHTHSEELQLAAQYGLRELHLLILKTASHGLTYSETGDVLGYSPETIKSAGPQITRALAAKTFAQAIANALRIGLIT